MISSIFGRTNPVNFLIVSLFLSFFLIGGYFLYLDVAFSTQTLWLLGESLALVLMILFLVDFINKKNNLTKGNSYTVLFFVLLFCLFPKIFNEIDLLISNVFILMAFRRIISLRSNRDVEIKIFDASLWVFVASFFYSWALFFIVLVFFALFLYKKNDYRNVLIPFVTLFVVLILAFTFYFLTNKINGFYDLLDFSPRFVIEKYEDIRYIVPLIFMCTMGGWAAIVFFLKKQSKAFKTRVPGILVMLLLGVSILVAILSESANTSELVYALFPLAVIIARYVESIRRLWLREVFISTFIIMPFIVLFL
ncbi:DUF6427 family protein [Galbibacter pacificus]|uniref:DUF6427 family protein n=1 Tax=Galbibacter pacificus TaxID=2996052 RepID=A0ABT6FUR0_9FLAO|nr:DUF6427 family protein [Galbibacter pacificus]MDG3583343.1 DUF6427 family protein [Galbibacter pacificus]MDG3586824.1 DUF6427 family protein [Galbibacter pacificus]